MNTSQFLGHQQLQIIAGLNKYARNLRRMFWCNLGLTISGVLLGVLYTLHILEIIDKNSPLMIASIGGLLVFAIAYLWIKADCLDFDLELPIIKWLDIACLLDFGAVMLRFGSRWFGGQEIVKPVSSVLGTLGLLMFIYFMRELAKYSQQQKLVKQAATILFAYSIGFVAMLIIMVGIKAKLFVGPFTVIGLGLVSITSLGIAFFYLQVLLWQLPIALRELAVSVSQHQEPSVESQTEIDDE